MDAYWYQDNARLPNREWYDYRAEPMLIHRRIQQSSTAYDPTTIEHVNQGTSTVKPDLVQRTGQGHSQDFEKYRGCSIQVPPKTTRLYPLPPNEASQTNGPSYSTLPRTASASVSAPSSSPTASKPLDTGTISPADCATPLRRTGYNPRQTPQSIVDQKQQRRENHEKIQVILRDAQAKRQYYEKALLAAKAENAQANSEAAQLRRDIQNLNMLASKSANMHQKLRLEIQDLKDTLASKSQALLVTAAGEKRAKSDAAQHIREIQNFKDTLASTIKTLLDTTAKNAKAEMASAQLLIEVQNLKDTPALKSRSQALLWIPTAESKAKNESTAAQLRMEIEYLKGSLAEASAEVDKLEAQLDKARKQQKHPQQQIEQRAGLESEEENAARTVELRSLVTRASQAEAKERKAQERVQELQECLDGYMYNYRQAEERLDEYREIEMNLRSKLDKYEREEMSLE